MNDRWWIKGAPGSAETYYKRRRPIRAQIRTAPTTVLPSFRLPPAFIEIAQGADGRVLLGSAELEAPPNKPTSKSLFVNDKDKVYESEGMYWVEDSDSYPTRRAALNGLRKMIRE
jgi:hypothetical protein